MAKNQRSESDAEKLRRRNRELSILNTIARALSRSVNLEEALHTTLAQVADLLDLNTGWIWLVNEETGKTYLAAAQNLPPVLAHQPRRMTGKCYCLDSYFEGDLDGATNVNVITCSRLSGLLDGTDGLRYHASIPLYAQEKKLGVLNLASSDWSELSHADLQLLYTVGDLLSIAIERARFFARSTQLGAVEERNRLAREIHDTLAQGMSAISLQLESADALLAAGADRERIRQNVKKALTLTRANLEEARRSVLNLRAASLEGHTLAEALSALVESVTGPGILQGRFEVTSEKRALPANVEVGLYRIAQEALTNVTRHAEASHVVVQLTITPQEVRLGIEDDGQGFDPSQVPPEHYGLIGLNERARLLEGTLQIQSCPDAGTRIEVVVPLQAKG